MEPLRRNLSGGVQATAADIYISYIRMYIHIYISKTYIDAEFDVESDGMVYLASKGHLHQDICEKHAFLNVCLPPTARVSLQPVPAWGLTVEAPQPGRPKGGERAGGYPGDAAASTFQYLP